MDHLFRLLAMLRAAGVSHQHAHWTSKGCNFYGDHLLFERIYTPIADQVDGLAEKAVQKFGPKAVDPCEQLEEMKECMDAWEREDDLVGRALLVEHSLQLCIKACGDELKKANMLSKGLDNFLAQLADDHETALYLLGQRGQED
jgi:DNA-binding ferritin-like protein